MSTNSSSKKRAAPEEKTSKSAGKGKKVAAAALPADVKEINAAVDVDADTLTTPRKESSDPSISEVLASGSGAATPAKKKRKVIRFNPHNPSEYLDLPRFWKNHESLRMGLAKAKSNYENASEKGDKDAAEAAAAAIERYNIIIDRSDTRRSDVLQQLSAISNLLQHGSASTTLVQSLSRAFDVKSNASAAASDDESAESVAVDV